MNGYGGHDQLFANFIDGSNTSTVSTDETVLMVVAQLTDQLLLSLEDLGSNTVIPYFYVHCTM